MSARHCKNRIITAKASYSIVICIKNKRCRDVIAAHSGQD
jgi:hypothetical protein